MHFLRVTIVYHFFSVCRYYHLITRDVWTVFKLTRYCVCIYTVSPKKIKEVYRIT